MKLLKKRILKKVLIFILTVVILSVSVGDVFIRTDDIQYADAAEWVIGGVVITAASMAEICLIVGITVVTLYCVGEVIDNKEAIAKAGYDFIRSTESTVDGWIASIVDTSGQEYVYGSEALELIRETDWEVIQGGLPPDDDDNNDDDKEDGDNTLINSLQNLVQLTPLAATWLFDQVSNLYHKWLNGDELTAEEMAALEPLMMSSCNQYDVAAQWSGEPFNYTMDLRGVNEDNDSFVVTIKESYTNSNPIAMWFERAGTDNYLYFNFLYGNKKGGVYDPYIDFHQVRYSKGNLKDDKDVYDSAIAPSYPNCTFTINANFPVFSSKKAAEAYLQGTGDVSDALNYAKTYREADWLADDWQGVLIDPLTQTALTLSQLIAVAKQLGLHAIGNNLSPQELLELLRKLLLGVDLDVLPEIPVVPAPVPDPALDPIYIPSPDAHPIPNPGEDPGTNPNPGTGTDPKPGTDPDPGGDPDPDIDLDENDYKVDLRGIFPFCIPFDFIALLNVLDADPVAPKFNFPVVIPALDYEQNVILDLSIFDDVAKVIRICEKVSFLIFLMFATSKVIRW